jgi:hypothetical protein
MYFALVQIWIFEVVQYSTKIHNIYMKNALGIKYVLLYDKKIIASTCNMLYCSGQFHLYSCNNPIIQQPYQGNPYSIS